MRVCICVSGQLRTSDEALVSLRNATAGLDATFIFSVWDRIGAKVDGPLNIHQLVRLFEAPAIETLPIGWFGADKFWRRLPTVRDFLTEQMASENPDRIATRIHKIFPDAIIDLEAPDLLSLDFDTERDDKNSVRMLYKIWRANEIKRKIERQDGKFDCVIRTRPDLFVFKIDTDLITSTCSDNKIFICSFNEQKTFIGDSFAAGTSRAIDRYSSLFGAAISSQSEWTHIHVNLAKHLSDADIDIERYPHLGLYANDQMVTATELAALLEKMRGTDDWSVQHEITARTLAANLAIAGDDAESARRSLIIEGEIADSDLDHLDAYFFVLAKTYEKLDEHVASGLCALLSIWLRHSSDINIQGATVSAFAHACARIADWTVIEDPQRLADYFLTGPRPVQSERLLGRALARLQEKEGLEVIETIARTISEAASHIVFYGAYLERASDATIPGLRRLAETVGYDRHPEFLRLLVLFGGRTGDRDGTIEALQSMVDGGIASVHERFRLADLLKHAGRFEEAYREQFIAVRESPGHAGANRQMAELCFSVGEEIQGAEFAWTAYNLDPNEPSHRLLVCYAEIRLGRVTPGANFPVDAPLAALPHVALWVPDFAGTIDRHVNSMTSAK
ncbi:hypothetical protein FM996_16590 [Methylosinus sporium]|uniref:Tetratricopeptide repeat protein n=1 Tax=Methylosinus sporium TaxID=428 RepID=A0A549SLJ8_METSR|nr:MULTISPECIES: hypothetical protein [Methylosinus]MBU3887818.1 hypothetical protein [Methylosinus sp. KRF6]TRL30495.1 hypothetical protein FM996_16590 [Methylosinus sporium]